MSFKQSSQTTENVLEEDDEGKQRQRECKVFSGVLEAKLVKSRLKIRNNIEVEPVELRAVFERI